MWPCCCRAVPTASWMASATAPGVVDLYVVAAAGDDDVRGVRHQQGEGVLCLGPRMVADVTEVFGDEGGQLVLRDRGRDDRAHGVGAGAPVYGVERGGQPVAVLIHDPALEHNAELVDSVCAAAGLTLENERLQAELRARLAELQASRARLVEATDGNAAGSSVTCTTGRSSGWSSSPCPWGCWSRSCRLSQSRPGRLSARPVRRQRYCSCDA